MKIKSEVQESLLSGSPIVALETTIISHGMPYPKNIETAREVEDIVRRYGAVPATIGIINGEICVGLTDEQLNYMATGRDIIKACERDLPFAIANGQSAATTVSASIAIAELVGIKVFVTGGIGGVAPREINSFDISADIPALSRHKTITVSSGVKSFMDIDNTMEVLETLGIPVMVYKSKFFPEFYTPGNKLQAQWIAAEPADVAKVFKSFDAINYPGSLLLTVPIPDEESIPAELIESAIEKAQKTIIKNHISGKEFTPIMLKSIVDITDGKSLDANIALIKNNAAIGARVAVEVNQLS